MKIFVSYSRRDAGDITEWISEHLKDEHDVFTDVNNIQAGSVWSSVIEHNISTCDLFVVLLTHAALRSPEVEKEVLQAQKENKTIIPYYHRDVTKNELKWNLGKLQGAKFEDKYDLARKLYSTIKKFQKEGPTVKKSHPIKKPDPAHEKDSSIFKKPPLQKNLRLLIPVIIVAVGSLFGVTFFYMATNIPDNYSFVNAWGSYGNKDGQFNQPYGIAVDDSSDFVYVADKANNRIQKFDSDGNFVTKWGSRGDEDGQFSFVDDNPRPLAGIAVDSSGFVYVADTFNNRIQKFDSNGNFVTKWGFDDATNTTDIGFYGPSDLAVDSSDFVYVADYLNDRIQKFDSNGNFVTKWGSRGDEDGQFDAPYGIAVDSSGSVYVADIGHDRIQKFDSDGNFVTKWGSRGNESGQFDAPYGIAVDSGFAYVADTANDRIQKFDSDGNFVTKWGSRGDEDGQFDAPYGIAVDDSSGSVYVADSGNNRIQVFS